MSTVTSYTHSFYLIQPFVVHKSVQQLLSFTLFHFFCGQRVGTVKNVSRRDLPTFRANDQLNLNQNSRNCDPLSLAKKQQHMTQKKFWFC